MDFELTEDQVALAGLVRAIVKGRFALDRIRQHEGAPSVVSSDDWAALGEAGVFSLTVPEAGGGAGLGFADAAIVFEELGRGLVPGPLVASHLAAGIGAEALVGAADGSVVVGAVDRPNAWSGEDGAVLIEHLGSLDALVVAGTGPGTGRGSRPEHVPALALVDPQSLDGRAVERSLDPLTPMWRVSALATGAPLGDAGTAERWERDSRVLTGALCVGIAAATCDLAVDYAKSRQQFGRPIGSFQAVKHLCADMLARAETARAAVQAAAVTIDQPDVGDATRAAAGAALLAAEAAVTNSRTCIQVHGGMGFTWEVPAHLFLMRAKVLASSLGPPDRLAAAVAERY